MNQKSKVVSWLFHSSYVVTYKSIPMGFCMNSVKVHTLPCLQCSWPRLCVCVQRSPFGHVQKLTACRAQRYNGVRAIRVYTLLHHHQKLVSSLGKKKKTSMHICRNKFSRTRQVSFQFLSSVCKIRTNTEDPVFEQHYVNGSWWWWWWWVYKWTVQSLKDRHGL